MMEMNRAFKIIISNVAQNWNHECFCISRFIHLCNPTMFSCSACMLKWWFSMGLYQPVGARFLMQPKPSCYSLKILEQIGWAESCANRPKSARWLPLPNFLVYRFQFDFCGFQYFVWCLILMRLYHIIPLFTPPQPPWTWHLPAPPNDPELRQTWV